MWNHIAIAHAAYRCIRAGYTSMGLLGSATTALSLLYHRSHERDYILPEGIAAKLSILMVAYHSRASGLSTLDTYLPAVLVFVLWRSSMRSYERWHPWLHLVVAADVHYFLHRISATT